MKRWFAVVALTVVGCGSGSCATSRQDSPGAGKGTEEQEKKALEAPPAPPLRPVQPTGSPDPDRDPVSAQYVEAYFEQMLLLAKNGHHHEAVAIALEIMALPDSSPEVKKIQGAIQEGLGDLLAEPEMVDLFPVVKHIEGDEIVYDNRKFNYVVRYPRGWRVFDETHFNPEGGYSGLILALAPGSGPEGLGMVHVGIVSHLLPEDGSVNLDSYVGFWMAALPRPREEVKDAIAAPSYHFRGTGEREGVTIVSDEVMLVRGPVGHYLLLAAPQGEHEHYYPVFKEFVNRIQFR